jgi:hypothetical protein
MKQITITMKLGAEPFVDPHTDAGMKCVLESLAQMAGVGGASVERPGTKRWVVRDGLGNQVGTAELS